MPADEPGDEAGGRGVVDRARRSDLLDAPVVHDHHRVRDRHRLLLRVGDVDEGDPEVALQPPELPAHAHAQERIQGGERFVEQEHRGVGDERAGERDPLLLPAGELRGHALPVVVHVDQLELLECHRVALGLRHSAHPQAERDVVQAVQVREQRVVLEHHGGRALGGRQAADVVSVDEDPPRADLLVARDHPQGRGLAATGRSEQAAVAAGGHGEVHVVDGGDAAVGLHDVVQLDAALGRGRRRGGRLRLSSGGPTGGRNFDAVSRVRHGLACCHGASRAARLGVPAPIPAPRNA